MTLTEIKAMMDSIATALNCDYDYYQFKEAPSLPFFVFDYPENADVFADTSNYINKPVLRIRLCTENKDFSSEALLEGILKDNGFTYSKEEDYIEAERMFQIEYLMEVIING